MRAFILFSIRMRTLVTALTVLVIGLGVWQLRDLPVDVVPEFSSPMIEVKTEALGLSSSEVEALVTVPLEADLLNGVPFLARIESESGAGVSSIRLHFVAGTDLYRARQMVQERLTQTHALPQVSAPPVMLQPVSSTSRILNIALSSDTVSLIELSVQARWTIVPRLVGVPGVANVSIWGRRDRQVHVEVDPEQLARRGMTLEQIVKTAGEAVFASPLTYLNSSTPGTGGFIDTPNQRLNIRHVSPINSPDRFALIPIHESTLPLGAVASVTEGHQPLIGDALIRDGSGLLLVVEKFPGADTQRVTRAVERALAELRPGLPGVRVDTDIYRPASYIDRATDNLERAGMLGLGAALLCLVLLATSWRTALIGLVALPLSVLAAVAVLHLRGASFDMLLIAGLMMALAAVVHDAVLDGEEMFRRLRAARASGQRAGLAATLAQGAMRARSAMLFATLIAFAAVAPTLFLAGQSRAFFAPLVTSYAIAILASMLVALTVTPALAMLLLRNMPVGSLATPPRGLGITNGLAAFNGRVAGPAWRSIVPAALIATVGAVVVAAGWSGTDRSLFPTFRETDLLIEWEGAPGTSLPAMRDATQRLTRDLLAVPGVRNTATQIGRAVLCNCGDVSDVNSAELWVSIDPAADYAATLAALRGVLRNYPGFSGSLESYLTQKLREALTGVEEALTVRIYGQDLLVLQAKAEEIRRLVASVPGVRNPSVEQVTQSPTIEIEVDLPRAARVGLKPGEVRRAVSTLVSGITVGALFEDQKVFDVVVWGPQRIRENVDEIRDLLLDTDGGRQVRLSEIAAVRTTVSPGIIRREGSSRRLDVQMEANGRPIAAVARDVAAQLSGVSFPFEYHTRILGEHLESRAAFRAIDTYLIAAGILAFLLLQAALGGWLLTLATLLGVPVVLLGVMLPVLLGASALSLGVLFGAGAAMLLYVRCSIMQVRHLQQLEREGMPFGDALVGEGLSDQFGTNLRTHMITIAFALPFVLAGDVAGLEILNPMAIALVGGAIASLVATLVVVPAVFFRVGRGSAADELGLVAEPA